MLFRSIIVDRILEVINISDDNISKISYINARIKSEYIRGIANTEDGIKIILDVLKILNSDELSLMKETVAS